MLHDAHNHLQFDELTPHWEEIERDLAGIRLGRAVVNGTHPDDDWGAVSALAARFPWVIPSYGVHPWDVGTRPADWQTKFTARFAAEPHAVVGEIGIDRWILKSTDPHDPHLDGVVAAPLEEQIEVFTWQLGWAAVHNRPASIHCLHAWGELLHTLRDAPLPRGGFLLHAYGGPTEMVPAFAELGAYFSFNTSFIDPHKTRKRAAFRAVPTDRLLVETDAPATPAPAPRFHLGDNPRINHPANLAHAYDDLASLRAIQPPALEEQIAANFERLFGPPRKQP